jgi:hypothetical protein
VVALGSTLKKYAASRCLLQRPPHAQPRLWMRLRLRVPWDGHSAAGIGGVPGGQPHTPLAPPALLRHRHSYLLSSRRLEDERGQPALLRIELMDAVISK